MKKYELTVIIESDDLELLKRARYKLCFAGRLKDSDFDVVWYATEGYLPNNRLEMTDEYEVFISQSFIPKEAVYSSVSPAAISLGEKCVIDQYGILSQSKTGEILDAAVLVNDYGPLHPGIARTGKGIRGEVFTNPFYVAPNLIPLGVFEFYPSFETQIWFAQDMDTGFALPQNPPGYVRAASTRQFTIDLEKRGSAVVSYSSGCWKII